jgi:hypothetical protein
MSVGQLLLVYLMAGTGVAGAVYLSDRSPHAGARAFRVLTALFFWPLYLPVLLAPQTIRPDALPPEDQPLPPVDELAHVISQVNAELDGALHSLDGWAEGVLAREKDRLRELRTAWMTQADRIRAMDRVLARQELVRLPDHPLPQQVNGAISARLHASQEVIRQNHDRLKQVRRRALEDLLGTVAWVRELVSMIHLAKFTGAPVSRAEELVAQIAAAVEGLSAVTGPMGDDGNIRIGPGMH